MKTVADWMPPSRHRRDRTDAMLSAVLLGLCGAVTGAFFGVLAVESAVALDIPIHDGNESGGEIFAWLSFGGLGALLGLAPGAWLGWRLP